MRNYLKRMEREGIQRVKMFLVITAAYVIFWGPLFFVTVFHHPLIGNKTGHEVTKIFFFLIQKKIFSAVYFGLYLNIYCFARAAKIK